jgi:hypothetical protein
VDVVSPSPEVAPSPTWLTFVRPVRRLAGRIAACNDNLDNGVAERWVPVPRSIVADLWIFARPRLSSGILTSRSARSPPT